MRLRAAILVLVLGAAPASADYTSTIMDDDPCLFYHMDNQGGEGTSEAGNGITGVGNRLFNGKDGGTENTSGRNSTYSAPPDSIPNRPTNGAADFEASTPSVNLVEFGYSGDCAGLGGEGSPCTQVGAPPNSVKDFTAECWIKQESQPASATIISQADGAVGGGGPFLWQWWLFTATNKVQAKIFVTGGSAEFDTGASTATLSTGVWYYVVFATDDASPRLQLYIDAVADVTTSSDLSVDDCDDNGRFRIGAFTENYGFAPFDGIIDECATYSTRLDATRILAHFEAMDGGGNIWPWTAKALKLPGLLNDGYFASVVQRGYVTSGLFAPRERQPQFMPLGWLPLGVYPSNSSTRR